MEPKHRVTGAPCAWQQQQDVAGHAVPVDGQGSVHRAPHIVRCRLLQVVDLQLKAVAFREPRDLGGIDKSSIARIYQGFLQPLCAGSYLHWVPLLQDWQHCRLW